MAKSYCGAGIIPINQGRILVMLEDRKDTDKPEYIDVGGKKEAIDKDSWDTALREFSEETKLPLPKQRNIFRSIWLQQGRYACYVVHYPYIPAPKGFKWIASVKELDAPIHHRLKKILTKL